MPDICWVLWGIFGEVIGTPFVVDHAVGDRGQGAKHPGICPWAKPMTPLATWRLNDGELQWNSPSGAWAGVGTKL